MHIGANLGPPGPLMCTSLGCGTAREDSTAQHVCKRPKAQRSAKSWRLEPSPSPASLEARKSSAPLWPTGPSESHGRCGPRVPWESREDGRINGIKVSRASLTVRLAGQSRFAPTEDTWYFSGWSHGSGSTSVHTGHRGGTALSSPLLFP